HARSVAQALSGAPARGRSSSPKSSGKPVRSWRGAAAVTWKIHGHEATDPICRGWEGDRGIRRGARRPAHRPLRRAARSAHPTEGHAPTERELARRESVMGPRQASLFVVSSFLVIVLAACGGEGLAGSAGGSSSGGGGAGGVGVDAGV